MLIFWLYLPFALDVNSFVNSVKTYPITTLINAKWLQTPLYLEIAEYLSDEDPTFFWDFIEHLSYLEIPLKDVGADSKAYLKSIDISQNLLSERQMPLMKLAVSMHSLTPRIQTHLQISQQVLESIDHKCDESIFVEVDNEIFCTLDELKSKLINEDSNSNYPETYTFDHIYPGSESNSKIVILYADIGSSTFWEYHKLLKNEASQGKLQYLFRHYLKNFSGGKVRLSGYGVDLHLKSTEYKSQDDSPRQNENQTDFDDTVIVEGFDFGSLKIHHPLLENALNRLLGKFLEQNEEVTPMKPWEFQDLGLQASQRVLEYDGDKSLHMLQYTVQNFPAQAKALLLQRVSVELKNEMKHNIEIFAKNLNLQPPDAALFVNGLFFDVETLDLAALLESLRLELGVLDDLHKNNFKGKIASSLLAVDLSETSNKEFAIDIRDSAIIWINNIENDKQYRRWPSSVMDFLRPSFPGMLRNIRKNIFNLVLVIDPVKPESRGLVRLSESFVIHLAPIRLGIAFDTRGEDITSRESYRAITYAFNYVSQNHDPKAALSFLTDVFASVQANHDINLNDIKQQLKKTFNTLSTNEIGDIVRGASGSDKEWTLSENFVERLNFRNSPQALLNGVPLQQHLLNTDDFEEAVFSEVMQQTPVFQKSIFRGELTDEDTLIDYLMNQPHVMPRLNQRILSSDNTKYLDLSGTPHDIQNINELDKLKRKDMTATLLNNIKYFNSKSKVTEFGNDIKFTTIWIIADLNQQTGKELLINALKYMKASANVRVAFIPNVRKRRNGEDEDINAMIWAISQTLEESDGATHVLKLLESNSKNILNVPDAVKELMSSTELHMKALHTYCQRVLNLKEFDAAVFVNGKIYGPLLSDEKFTVDDFNLIEKYNYHNYIEKLISVIKPFKKDLDLNSDKLLKLFSTLVPRHSKSRFAIPTDVKEDYSVVKIKPINSNKPYFDIVAILDPASRGAQKLTPFLILLRKVINCDMRVFLCAVEQHSDMPVKNFYRFVVEPEVTFHHDGRLASGPMAKFTNLPITPLLTQNLQVPENWLVEPVRSVYDLDNIKLFDIGGPVHSEFELEYLLLEGHCFDSNTGAPPRGLQITLGTQQHPARVDTIVMANLGYFQLKANPGTWDLKLRHGKSSDIYDMVSAEGPNTIYKNNATKVVINSLRSHVIKLKVAKKGGVRNADLLDDDDNQPAGIWDSFTSSFGGRSESAEGDTINIFSVASGHLYERLLRIMMLSLLKHTKSPVKFWFLKNYLSPQFIDLLPHMAKNYGFQFELVQYKWPRWLHQQTEKQRTIWGYKILFLDVLFPLDIKKIIFVDADAVVRADIKELNDLDLDGAPYAYTPFCDSRKEMEGFRFWKQGYWRNHLMGRKYHISAIYVVDLKKFRKIAAGDRLRGQYQALSQDPNSLSNLDQDLPNNMIHQVAIKSLPNHWLWCSTWCSEDSFAKAKVIDLCNNPLTKEAKLTAAERIVPEWKDYDLEIKALSSSIEDHEMENDEIGQVENNNENSLHSEL